ncbi:hypothetical protein P5673_028892 [Acropora cervicornis]|uniref:Uncharacterized protein n=1 Tax=Acropora cervicornis TaxID=6130 RepID=A0AAD9PWI8_ACRCE|nr:hypothetical protein P5673_028892 [Acropora cervicornis]
MLMILNCTPPLIAKIRMILPLQFPGLKAVLLPQRLPSIKIETDIIETTNKARNIDVIFDNTVTMSFHFNNIMLNNLAPANFVDLIHVYEPARYLRSASDKWGLVVKPCNLKTYGLRTFSVIASILWNDLPIDIRWIDDINEFKS